MADAKTALAGLAGALRARDVSGHSAEALASIRARHDEWAQSLQEPIAAWDGPGIHPGQACAVVGAVFGSEAVYCVDGGMTSLWAGLALPSTRPSSFHGILELGMLGVGIPAAVGARLGAPEREVV